MCGFDIRCAAEQETEVNGMGNNLLIIWDIGPERAPPVPYRKSLHNSITTCEKRTFEMLK